ncbi:MAG TPA: DUF5916 domain-containing protein [Thermoanaerobaculia bacterium]|nr:DUF5916 domain-containing protein [Thermoanaerobaculia bacterium]
MAIAMGAAAGGARAAQNPAPELGPSAAAATRTYEVRRADGEIAVDGRLDEAAWAGAHTFTLDYETYPGDNVPPPVRTEMWIAYDLENLYVGVRAHDPEPEKIRARLRDRDAAFQDDFVGVVLDTFNDERRAFEFFVNPLGVQMDLLQNDVTGAEDASWDALWSSAGRVTEGGYEVEMAIPFSSLRFPRTSGPQTWGIDAVRVWPRDQRRRIGLNELPRGRNCYLCHGAKLTGFSGITPGRNLEIAPTLTATDVAARGGAGQRFEGSGDQELGLTARWGVTPATTVGATLNPDFSQVEADAAQLAVNTQFALFFPEKRPFFLEGADFFDTKIGAVYTRNIADPDWGAKVTGKSGKSAYGLIVAEDARTNLLIPGSQSSELAFLEEENLSTVLRYRRDLSGSSSVGGLLTSREGDGYHNRLAGIDYLLRWNEGDAFRVEVLGSQTEYPDPIRAAHGQPEGSLEGTAARVAYQHQTQEWMGYLLYNDVSADFRADLGFVPRAGFRTGFGMVERYWYADPGERRWSRFTLGAETTWTYDEAGEPLQNQVAPYVRVNGPRQSFLNLYLGYGPSWFNGRELDRTFVVAYGEVQATPSVYLSLESRVGEEIDFDNARQGEIVRLVPRARFDLGRHLRLSLSHNHESLDVAGGRLYTANLTDVRASYQVNVRTFVRLVTQYFDLERDPALYTFPTEEHASSLFNQLLFSYKVNPQTVVFLGYSDNYQGDERAIDRLPQTNRTLFLKLGYALVL